jgi:putative flippase GtrA
MANISVTEDVSYVGLMSNFVNNRQFVFEEVEFPSSSEIATTMILFSYTTVTPTVLQTGISVTEKLLSSSSGSFRNVSTFYETMTPYIADDLASETELAIGVTIAGRCSFLCKNRNLPLPTGSRIVLVPADPQ